MRLIDADAYAEDLWKLRANYQMLDDTHTADKIMYGIFRAEQALKEQPTVAASPWNKVESKDDLPKESNTYIVYLRQGTKVETPEWMGGEPLSYVVEMEFDREHMLWRADEDAYNAILSFVDTERDFHVTHWTEKPEPPKEDA